MKATDKLTAEKAVVEAIMEERHKKKKAKKMKKICIKTLKFAMSTTGLMIANIGVMLLGGFIFSRLEEVNEKQSCVNSRLDYQKAENATIILLMDMATQLAGQTALSDQQRASTQADFQKYLQDFAGGVLTTGYDPALVCETLGEPDGASLDWSFEGAVLFALTVVTTIGMKQLNYMHYLNPFNLLLSYDSFVCQVMDISLQPPSGEELSVLLTPSLVYLYS